LKDDENKDNDKNNPIDVQKLTGHSISILRETLELCPERGPTGKS
jgi:hypothetical protein